MVKGCCNTQRRIILILVVCLLILSLTIASAEDQFIPNWSSVPWGPFNLFPHPSVTNPVLMASHVTDVSARYVADPFLFFENGTWYLFFEVVKESNSRGEIGLATSTDGVSWAYDRIVLREDFHLSYPQVFKYGNDYYMMPETSYVQEARLYRASNFPYGWTYAATLLTGNIHDASIFRYNDTWWMFFGDYGYNGQSDNCYLYYSDNLFSGWQQHPMSPIVDNDRSKARPAGRPFVYDGNTIIRLAQKNDVSYGESVRAFQVDTLTKTSYTEHEIAQSPLLTKSGSGWNAAGMHTLDPWWTGNDWLCAVDGKDTNGKWSIGIYSLLTNQLNIQTAGAGHGTVSSTPAAIDCGDTCNASLPQGTVVKLTATPEYGSALSLWTGCDEVDNNTCTVTLGSDRTVTANFDLIYENMVVQKSGTGHGTITSTPAAIDCGDTCNASLPQGTVVKLTATPEYGSALSLWTGCDEVDNNTCTVTLGSDRTVTGDFRTVTEVKLLSPNGGEVIPAGLPQYPITWEAPGEAVKFKLKGSAGLGVKTAIIDRTTAAWDVPLFKKNKTNAFVKVIAYDITNRQIGYDISDGRFTIEAVSITAPNQETVCTGGLACPITWTKSPYVPVTSIDLYYSLNKGYTWKKMLDTPLPPDVESFDWIAPSVSESKTKCKVKVVLRDSDGNVVGSAVSEGSFAVLP